MKSIWSYITYLTSFLTLSPDGQDASRQSTLGPHGRPIVAVHNEVNVVNVIAPAVSNGITTLENSEPDSKPGPIFIPTTDETNWAGAEFKCDYSRMVGWESCRHKEPSCWIRKIGTGAMTFDDDDPGKSDPDITGHYNIDTDYEQFYPIGTTRDYTLVVKDGQWNADGRLTKDAKLINGTYPGPLIQACWGDTVRIKVINELEHNGTAIHWHGIRQHNSMEMDGVPGITQCPIAPNDHYTYEFTLKQYGDSWYHSHYSVQYADGLLGPLIIHGPSSSDWDYHVEPLLMSDWFHNSAFQVIHEKVPGLPTILLNGAGDISQHEFVEKDENGKDIMVLDPETKEEVPLTYRVAPTEPIPPKYQLHVKEGKKYLIRIINTSFSTTFVFSIDYHNFTIVGADLVPVEPYGPVTHLEVGIGQRYSIILTAEPAPVYTPEPMPPGYTPSPPPAPGSKPEPRPGKGNFWIRTTIVNCFRKTAIGVDNYNKLGILRYDEKDLRLPRTKQNWEFDNTCVGEVYLKPKLAWNLEGVTPVQPDPAFGGLLTKGQTFAVEADFQNGPLGSYPLGKWAVEQPPKASQTERPFYPMQISYDDPFILHLAQLSDRVHSKFNPLWMVIKGDFEKDGWVFMAITGKRNATDRQRSFDAAHPMHLHGHDFAILKVVQNGTIEPFNKDSIKGLNLTNPTRRDSVLLPASGWVILAFKADNPGSWILHCHIAFHASEGLGLQISERQRDANAHYYNPAKTGSYHPAIVETERVCRSWGAFQSDCTKHWPGYDEKNKCYPACTNTRKDEDLKWACVPEHDHTHYFQDDSGV